MASNKALPPIPSLTPMTITHPTTFDPSTPVPSSTTQPPFLASTHLHDGKKHLLLTATGSVATIKVPDILTHLSRHSSTLSIILLLTPSATHFLHTPSFTAYTSLYPNLVAVFTDEDEWVHRWERGSGILHIELRRWADLMVIAPLSANSLAGIVGGFANGLVLSVVRAWDADGGLDANSVAGGEAEGESVVEDGGRRRERRTIIVAAAMNTAMWRHPVTRKQIRVLEEEWGVSNTAEGGWFEVLRPVEKTLACGDVGDGAMRDWKEICGVIEERLGLVREEVGEEGEAEK